MSQIEGSLASLFWSSQYQRVDVVSMPPVNQNAITTYWFANTADTLNRVSQDSSESHSIEWRNDFQASHLTLLQSLTPGHVVVLEELCEQSALNDKVSLLLSLGNSPTIVCLGKNISIEYAVDWMRQGIFYYLEHTASASTINHALGHALKYAGHIREKYIRFRELDDLWNSVSARESVVLDMILEGVPNKTIAARLAVSQRTIEARRQKLYQKLASKSLPGVVQTICEWKQLRSEFGKSAKNGNDATGSNTNTANQPHLPNMNNKREGNNVLSLTSSFTGTLGGVEANRIA